MRAASEVESEKLFQWEHREFRRFILPEFAVSELIFLQIQIGDSVESKTLTLCCRRCERRTVGCGHGRGEQERGQRGPKVYSLHAPEVECIGKGKPHEPYEFGVKVSVATTLKRCKGGLLQSMPRRCPAMREAGAGLPAMVAEVPGAAQDRQQGPPWGHMIENRGGCSFIWSSKYLIYLVEPRGVEPLTS